ncbi:Kinesin-like protein KIF6 [Dufourea novaeangliae]|uniref:Kinesin-like protein KIF6 n=1 Tax=Dufourea novaeangliae TaxID=178035 RepID=A0A154P293_DUFNO|nr:Kinesin-like protein KIF6 [Dufourea novaeangliae]
MIPTEHEPLRSKILLEAAITSERPRARRGGLIGAAMMNDADLDTGRLLMTAAIPHLRRAFASRDCLAAGDRCLEMIGKDNGRNPETVGSADGNSDRLKGFREILYQSLAVRDSRNVQIRWPRRDAPINRRPKGTCPGSFSRGGVLEVDRHVFWQLPVPTVSQFDHPPQNSSKNIQNIPKNLSSYINDCCPGMIIEDYPPIITVDDRRWSRRKPLDQGEYSPDYKVYRRPRENLEEDYLTLNSPTQKTKDYPDNRPESWNYSFFRIFDESSSQEDVFENVAQPVMESALDGYNGTIFAYGQTASGKTYSIIGHRGVRGIIPRCLQYLFDVIQKRPENVYTVEVAFLEIYNENGYDLLDRRQREFAVTRLEDLPRVTIQEDENGQLHLKNLTFHGVGCLEDAFELLLVGDNNRVTTETPMNPQSSRSHCIFTIILSMKEFGADRYKRVKVHLVDLAGSERVYKCSITGTILTEAKHINLSLHYLEQVIVCLGQETAGHIPYRNSYLTSILRDSLGGNCMTTMLATLSLASSNMEETISTCRFAQRVALIKNDVRLVLETSIQSENALLKLENERLKQHIRTLTGQTESQELSAEIKWKLDSQIRNFLESNTKICWDYSPKSIDYCFDNFKRTVQLCRDPNSCLKKMEYYKDMVLQRDKEISLLIDLLKKERGKQQCNLKEGLTGDGESNTKLTDKSRTRNGDSEGIKLCTESIGEPCLEMIQPTSNRCLLTTVLENRTKNAENTLTNVNTSSTIANVLGDKIISTSNHILPKKHKKKLKDSKSVLLNHIENNLQSINIDESRTNCNKNDVNNGVNAATNNIAKIVSRKNSLEQISMIRKISTENLKPELLNCNVVNLTMPNSTEDKDKSIGQEENQQSLRKSEKKQIRHGDIKPATKRNIRSRHNSQTELTINEECNTNRKTASQNIITEDINEQDHSISFYQKTLKSSVCSFTAEWPEKSNIISGRRRVEKEGFDAKTEYNGNNDSFEDSLPLTGDPEIDEEIIAFYKAKRSGGIY